MFSILKALIKIAKNLQEIRDILSIVHYNEIERYKLEQQTEKEYGNRKKKDKEVEFIAKEIEEDEDQVELEFSYGKEEDFKW